MCMFVDSPGGLEGRFLSQTWVWILTGTDQMCDFEIAQSLLALEYIYFVRLLRLENDTC